MDMNHLAKNSEHPKQLFSIFSRNCINVACCHPLIGNPLQKQNDDATMTLPDVRSCLYAQTHVQVVPVLLPVLSKQPFVTLHLLSTLNGICLLVSDMWLPIPSPSGEKGYIL